MKHSTTTSALPIRSPGSISVPSSGSAKYIGGISQDKVTHRIIDADSGSATGSQVKVNGSIVGINGKRDSVMAMMAGGVNTRNRYFGSAGGVDKN